MTLQPTAAFLVFKAQPWDEHSGKVNAPSDGPPSLRQLRGYALHGVNGLGIEKDLSRIAESVIIVDAADTMRALGLLANPYSMTGMYQTLPSGHRVVFLPWADYDKRRQRSEMWKQYLVRQVEVAKLTAAGQVKPYVWGRLVAGESPEALQALQDMLAAPQPLAVDVETVGDMPNMAITAIGIASATCSVSIPWAGYTSRVFGRQKGLENNAFRGLIGKILASMAHPKVFHNGGFDRAVFASLGLPCNGEYEDTILLMKIIFPELYRNLQFSAGMAAQFESWKDGFKAERERLFADPTAKAAIKAQKLKKLMDDWAEIPLDALLLYNCKDAAATLVLFEYLKTRLARTHEGQRKYDKLRGLAEMAAEQWLYGVAIDLEARNKLVLQGRKDLAALVWKWRKIVGPGKPPYGPGSKAKLNELFFKTYKAPVIVRSESTKEPSLNTYSLTCWDTSGRQPLSDAAFYLFRIRKLQKNLTAFLGPLDADRVYAKPNVTGTVGTRFSYSEPNLQQWAKEQKATRFTTGEKVKLAPNVRKLVIAEPGCMLLEADYNALEARAVAYRTANNMWFDWMARNQDMHVQHVFLMYGVWLHRKGCKNHGCDGAAHYCTSTQPDADWDDPDSLRQVTKVTTYARFYNRKGNSEPVVRMLKSKMPTLEKAVVDKVFATFDAKIPNIVTWHQTAALNDAANRYIQTGLGGWRLPVGDKVDDNRNRSFEIQSTVGDVVCEAMLKLRPLLDASRQQRMLFQVHDAFILQCREADAVQVGRTMKECMEWVIPSLWGYKDVVFPVDVKCGKNWADMAPLHL